jgi:hypothetical protein
MGRNNNHPCPNGTTAPVLYVLQNAGVKDNDEKEFLHYPMSAINWLNTCSPY